MDGETVRVGIVGAGMMGGAHSNAYASLRDVEVVAVASARRAQADKLAEVHGAAVFDDWRALVDGADMDVVDVCLPTPLHAEVSIAALESGRHVLCEKPMALSVADADAMVAAAKERDRKLMIGHVLRFWAEYQVLDQMRAADTFGPLRSFIARRAGALPGWAWENWIQDNSLSGGAALDLHIHDLDFLQHLFGLPRAVFATGRGTPPGSCQIQTTLLYEDDIVASAEGSWHPAPAVPFEMAFTAGFEAGYLAYSSRRNPTLFAAPGMGEGQTPELPESTARFRDGQAKTHNPYTNEIDYFLDCVRRNEEPARCPAVESRDAVRVTLAALESCKRKEPVAL